MLLQSLSIVALSFALIIALNYISRNNLKNKPGKYATSFIISIMEVLLPALFISGAVQHFLPNVDNDLVFEVIMISAFIVTGINTIIFYKSQPNENSI